MRMLKNTLLFVWEVSKIALVALMIVAPIRIFVFQPFFVKGQSMEPNFHNSDYLIIDEISYRFNEPQRGDVIVFKYPLDQSQKYIKRIVGMPNETIEIRNNQVVITKYIDTMVLNESEYLPVYAQTPGNVKITLSDDEYFVMGDNRTASSDSRKWGVLPRDNIIGKAILRPWPLEAYAKIDGPEY